MAVAGSFMKASSIHGILIGLLAVLFAVGLAFASIELPRLVDTFLQREVPSLNIDSHADEESIARTELYIRSFYIRVIGYACFSLTLLLIIAGFATERSGLASAGALLLFLPVFGTFAATMFFLAGLGLLYATWMPFLDISFGLLDLGRIVHVPYNVLLTALSKLGVRANEVLPYAITGLGLFLFVLGVTAWMHARFQGKPVADLWIYRFSRHPQYLGWIVWSYGMILLPGVNMKRSWNVPTTLPWIISSFIIIAVAMLEEMKMAEQHGDQYESYRQKTPLLFPLLRIMRDAFALPFRILTTQGFPTKKWHCASVMVFYCATTLALSAVLVPSKVTEMDAAEMPTEEHLRIIGTAEGRRDKWRAISNLASLGEPAVEPLLQLVKNSDDVVREFSVQLLGDIRSDKSIDALIEALSDGNPRVRASAASSLGKTNVHDAVPDLVTCLSDPSASVRISAAGSLGRIGDMSTRDSIAKHLQDDVWFVRVACMQALAEMRSSRSATSRAAQLKDEHVRVRRAAAYCLLQLSAPQSAHAQREATHDDDWEVRFNAAEAIKRIEIPNNVMGE